MCKLCNTITQIYKLISTAASISIKLQHWQINQIVLCQAKANQQFAFLIFNCCVSLTEELINRRPGFMDSILHQI